MTFASHISLFRPRNRTSAIAFACAATLFSNVSEAQGAAGQIPGAVLDMNEQPVPQLGRIRVDEHLLDPLPLDAAFLDQNGRTVTLGDYFDGERPVLLTFAYHTCPTLCSMVLNATVTSVRDTEWTAGEEYQLVTISIDPRDSTEISAAKREEVLASYGRLDADEEGWAFLTGTEEEVARVAAAAGYHFFWDVQQQQYGHPAAILFATPDGKIARYLYGLTFDPSDVRLALLEASEGRSISTGERFLLYCYTYNPHEGEYTVFAQSIMKLGGVATIVFLGGFLFLFWRRERRKARQRAQSDSPSFSSGDATAH